jgi:hypothetical protein
VEQWEKMMDSNKLKSSDWEGAIVVKPVNGLLDVQLLLAFGPYLIRVTFIVQRISRTALSHQFKAEISGSELKFSRVASGPARSNYTDFENF